MNTKKTVTGALVALVMVALPAPAVATPACVQISGLAGAMMMSRQNGKALEDVFESIRSTIPDKPDVIKTLQTVAMEAYSHPRYSVKANQDKAVMDFRNETFLHCLRAQ